MLSRIGSSGTENNSESNFRQPLPGWMKSQGNVHTSANIQNKMLQVMTLLIIKQINISVG